ncbi:hypothetical protein ACWC0C_47635 [Streptomyces sp. NPDC001709]
MTFSRRVLGILAILASLIGANLLFSQSAQAATSCSGTITADYTISYPGDGVIGELTVYYNSSNGGTNSACLYHRGKTSGVASLTDVVISKCSQTSGSGKPCSEIAQDRDTGQYSSYAGPVGVTGTANNCVAVHGFIEYRGGTFAPQGQGYGYTVGC